MDICVNRLETVKVDINCRVIVSKMSKMAHYFILVTG